MEAPSKAACWIILHEVLPRGNCCDGNVHSRAICGDGRIAYSRVIGRIYSNVPIKASVEIVLLKKSKPRKHPEICNPGNVQAGRVARNTVCSVVELSSKLARPDQTAVQTVLEEKRVVTANPCLTRKIPVDIASNI